MKTATARRTGLGLVAASVMLGVSCASNPRVVSPGRTAYPTFERPEAPASLGPEEARLRHDDAWRRLQAGDVRGAVREFTALGARWPGFYPATTGLGYARLAAREFAAAADRFRAALAYEGRYAPAWHGLVDAELGQGREAEAIEALERLVALDPGRDGARTRLDVLRLKAIERLVSEAQAARRAGRTAEAIGLLERALVRSPTSVAILRELASAEAEAGQLEAAERHARRALQVDPTDPASHAALGAVSEARGRLADAIEAFTNAAALDGRFAGELERVRSRADFGGLPKDLSRLADATSVTRAEAAAYMGVRLERLLLASPRRVVPLATDVRHHWAEPWILTVTAAGVMDILPNHTFQPSRPVRRDELAAALSVLIETALAGRPGDLAHWKAARPRFADVPDGHFFYANAALAVTAGAMTSAADGRFQPTQPISGADFVRAIGRIDDLIGR